MNMSGHIVVQKNYFREKGVINVQVGFKVIGMDEIARAYSFYGSSKP